MTDEPSTTFTVPPGGAPSEPPSSTPPPTPPSTPAPSMPPLGPPYTEPTGQPPPLRYPLGPPEQWPAPPPVLPDPVLSAPVRARWLDDPRHQAVVWGAIAIVFAVIVGALIGASAADRPRSFAAPITSSDESTESTSSESESDPTTTTSPQSLEDIVLEIEHFVERERGLKFKQPVDVSIASDDEFDRLLQADVDKQRESLLEAQAVLSALGLIPPDFDLIAAEESLVKIAAVGRFDLETKKLVVRGTRVTPFVRHILAHELTHALDDQWFDLNRPEVRNADDDSGFGFLGLIEGNANRIDAAYLASLSQDEQAQATLEEQSLVLQHPEILDLPPILLSLSLAPYVDGPVFIDALLDAGGQSTLDAAFSSPPITAEQILEPERYLAGEGPVAVPAPKADGAQTSIGVLGELLLRELLFDALPSGARVQRAITGWGGDSYVTWTDTDGRSCLRDTVVGDTQDDTQELLDAIREWGADRDVVIDAPPEGPATFTACA